MYVSNILQESTCECGIKDECAQFQHCLEGKIIILEELNITREEKRKSDEARNKAEEKLRLAEDKIRKMEEMMQKVVDQKMELELQLADIVDGQNIKAESARMKMKKIEKYALQQEKKSKICLRCYCYLSRGYNLYVRICQMRQVQFISENL